ncbi:hypothetical protein D3C80_1687950 [compost metagenome]
MACAQALDSDPERLAFIQHAAHQNQPGKATQRLTHCTDETLIGVAFQASGKIAQGACRGVRGSAAQCTSPGQQHSLLPGPERALRPIVEALLQRSRRPQLVGMRQDQPVFDGHPAQCIAQRFVPWLAKWATDQHLERISAAPPARQQVNGKSLDSLEAAGASGQGMA